MVIIVPYINSNPNEYIISFIFISSFILRDLVLFCTLHLLIVLKIKYFGTSLPFHLLRHLYLRMKSSTFLLHL